MLSGKIKVQSFPYPFYFLGYLFGLLPVTIYFFLISVFHCFYCNLLVAISNLNGNSHQWERMGRNNMGQHQDLLLAGADLFYRPNSNTKLGLWGICLRFQMKVLLLWLDLLWDFWTNCILYVKLKRCLKI